MKKFLVSDKAASDLKDIHSFIAKNNRSAADRTIMEIYRKLHELSEDPFTGHKREDLTEKDYRFFSVYSYMIIYNPNTLPVTILRIISSYRNLPQIL